MIKDSGLRPYKLEKKQKREGKEGEGTFTLSFPSPARRTDNEEKIKRVSEKERERERERGGGGTIESGGEATTRDQSDTKSTDVRSTARAHKRAPVHTSARALALDAGYSLVICVTLCMRCFPLGYSRQRRPVK